MEQTEMEIHYPVVFKDARVYPKAGYQRCVTNVNCRLLSQVRNEDKFRLAGDLREVFATDRQWYDSVKSLRLLDLQSVEII